jgi:preprotein translocase subunit SecD
MVGFVGALIGGAMKGFGSGQMEEIKQKREEKLKDLDRQFTSEQNALSRTLQEKQIASSERQANASLAMQGEIARSGQANTLAIAKLSNAGETERNTARITAATDLAELQNKFELAKGYKTEQFVDESGKTITRRVNAAGEPLPNVVIQGKEYSPVPSGDDSTEIKNYKFLKSLGTYTDEQINAMVFEKSGDRAKTETDIFKALGANDFTPPTEAVVEDRTKLAKKVTDSILGTTTDTPQTDYNAIPESTLITNAKAALAHPGITEAKKQAIREAFKGRVPPIDLSKVPGL